MKVKVRWRTGDPDVFREELFRDVKTFWPLVPDRGVRIIYNDGLHCFIWADNDGYEMTQAHGLPDDWVEPEE